MINYDDEKIVKLTIKDYESNITCYNLGNIMTMMNFYTKAYICIDKFLYTPKQNNADHIKIDLLIDNVMNTYISTNEDHLSNRARVEIGNYFDTFIGTVVGNSTIFNYVSAVDRWSEISLSSLNSLTFHFNYEGFDMDELVNVVDYVLSLKIKFVK